VQFAGRPSSWNSVRKSVLLLVMADPLKSGPAFVYENQPDLRRINERGSARTPED